VICVSIVHITYDGRESLPAPLRRKWKGGVTEIIHVAGAEQ
jgi:hypothetical protein